MLTTLTSKNHPNELQKRKRKINQLTPATKVISFDQEYIFKPGFWWADKTTTSQWYAEVEQLVKLTSIGQSFMWLATLCEQ